SELMLFCFSSRRRHTRLQGDWVQTCALPISDEAAVARRDERRRDVLEALTGEGASGVPELGLMIRARGSREIDATDVGSSRLDEIGRASCRVSVLVVGSRGSSI